MFNVQSVQFKRDEYEFMNIFFLFDRYLSQPSIFFSLLFILIVSTSNVNNTIQMNEFCFIHLYTIFIFTCWINLLLLLFWLKVITNVNYIPIPDGCFILKMEIVMIENVYIFDRQINSVDPNFNKACSNFPRSSYRQERRGVFV